MSETKSCPVMRGIKLTLRSDLCASSGVDTSLTVDTDICHDRFGIPYIPGRRLKGCLRDAACYIGTERKVIERLFGVPGSEAGGALAIGNGYLEAQDDLKAALSALQGELRVSPEQVLQLFSSVRSRTAIGEGGTAQKNTLRYTRVLNHRLPYGDQPTTFFFHADVHTSDAIEQDELERALERICWATRSMGLNRTRGLGSVLCEYVRGEEESDRGDSGAAVGAVIGMGDDCCSIPLLIRLRDALLIAAPSAEQCAISIPGTALLGALARLYILSGRNSDSPEFAEIFLSGRVRFENLYISDENGTECVPTPAYVCKLKDHSGARDGERLTAYAELSPEEVTHIDRSPVRGGMMDRALRDHPVLVENVYHHSRMGERVLYTQSCLSAGQYMRGRIMGPRKSLNLLSELLKGGELRLGKSKTAQYSACELLPFPCENETSKDDRVAFNAGDVAVFSLESDVLLVDGQGVGTLDPCQLLRGLLPDADDSALDAESKLSFRLIRGYNAKRNLQNVPVQAFSAGSVLVARVGAKSTLPRQMLIGIRQAEGYGHVRVEKRCELAERQPEQQCTVSDAPVIEPEKQFSQLIESIKRRSEATNAGMELYKQHRDVNLTGLTLSLVSRALLMVEQANDDADLTNRIRSIKSDKGKVAKRLLALFADTQTRTADWRTCMTTILQLKKFALKEEE